MDADESALRFAAERGLAELAPGCLPDNIPFDDMRFDLAVMTDVLEHLDDEVGSLRAVHARLKPGGSLLITVPAMQWLWSEHDTTHHHRRRYRAADLSRLMSGVGFTVDYVSYYNFILFPAIAAIRTLQRMRSARSDGVNRHDLAMPPAIVNAILFRLFSSERYVMGAMRIPFGISLIVLAHS
jgi:SAM-dependent methyltransferase